MDTEILLTQIQEYCARVDIRPTTFGRHAVKDGKFFSRLKSGGQCLPSTAAKVMEFLNAPPPEKWGRRLDRKRSRNARRAAS